MKHILLFGAGKSATVLIDYLKKLVAAEQWQLTVADGNLDMVQAKVGVQDNVTAIQLDIHQADARTNCIQQADVVISMMPPQLHYLIALDCLNHGKHLLTASYVDEPLKELHNTIQKKGLLFLCEMGLDPGIDHMSAMQLIHSIQEKGGNVHSFKSHCGGLIAPESDTNPWHYKISWNPKNIVLAGKAGAHYLEDGVQKHLPYEALFNTSNQVQVEENFYAYYLNRDSLSYMPLYGLEHAHTFMRTTLRHIHFVHGWQQIVALRLTDEEVHYQTNGVTIAAFFQQHLERFGLQHVFAALQADELLQQQFAYLELATDKTLINKERCSAAAILQMVLEQKWKLATADKDLIVMLHEIEYNIGVNNYKATASLVVKGQDSLHTAMAKTVGLPLGIAAKLLLQGKITATGLHIPTLPNIYTPVLQELEQYDVCFEETTMKIS
jgi:saccharopine dehydrogenase-like NADP-dependent oxidoreductase